MDNDKNIEEKLLSGKNIDELLSCNIQQKMLKERQEARREKVKSVTTDFDALPEEMTFSEKTTYLVFNRKTKTESFINGLQADSLIGLDQSLRTSLLGKMADNFTVGDYYVTFSSYTEVK